MLGKIIPYLFIAMINMLSVLAIGCSGSRFPSRVASGCSSARIHYVFSGLGLGLLISTVSQNQRQAQQLFMLFEMVGMVWVGSFFRATRCPG